MVHTASLGLQLKPRAPRPSGKRLEHEPAEIRPQPAFSRHQHHRFLLLAALTEGNKQGAFRAPCRRSHIEATGLCGFHDNKKVVGRLRRGENALEKHFVLPIPHAWFGAFKYIIDHRQSVVRIKASDAVESDMAWDLWPRSDVAIHRHARSVEVRRPSESSRITLVVPATAAPDTSETRNCNQHRGHAPFNRLFFCRSAYNASCKRLICPTNFMPSPFSSPTVDVAALWLPRSPFAFLARLSIRLERSATISSFCRSSSRSLLRSRIVRSSSVDTRWSSAFRLSAAVSRHPGRASPDSVASMARLHCSMCALYLAIASAAVCRENRSCM